MKVQLSVISLISLVVAVESFLSKCNINLYNKCNIYTNNHRLEVYSLVITINILLNVKIKHPRNYFTTCNTVAACNR